MKNKFVNIKYGCRMCIPVYTFLFFFLVVSDSLFGLTGVGGLFTAPVIKEMYKHVKQ
jgi:hypothetical protein